MPDYDAWARAIDPEEGERWRFRHALAVEQFMARQNIRDDTVFRGLLCSRAGSAGSCIRC